MWSSRMWSGPIAVAALLLCVAGPALAAPAGSVVGLSGACIVESGGKRMPLALGAGVQVGDTVEVPADGRLKLRMADGSIVGVAAGTRFKIAVYAVAEGGQRQDAVLSLGEGLLHAVVAPARQPARFEVDTAIGAAAARSTDWFIETSLTADDVTVLSGSVAVTSAATKHSVLVSPHQSTHLEAGRDPAPPHAVPPSDFARIIGRTEFRDRRPAPPHAAPRRAEHRSPPHPYFRRPERHPPAHPEPPGRRGPHRRH